MSSVGYFFSSWNVKSTSFAVAQREHDGRRVGLLGGCREPRRSLTVEVVDDRQRLIDVERADALVREVGVEVLLEHWRAVVGADEHGVVGDRRVGLALDLNAAAGCHERDGREQCDGRGTRTSAGSAGAGPDWMVGAGFAPGCVRH